VNTRRPLPSHVVPFQIPHSFSVGPRQGLFFRCSAVFHQVGFFPPPSGPYPRPTRRKTFRGIASPFLRLFPHFREGSSLSSIFFLVGPPPSFFVFFPPPNDVGEGKPPQNHLLASGAFSPSPAGPHFYSWYFVAPDFFLFFFSCWVTADPLSRGPCHRAPYPPTVPF